MAYIPEDSEWFLAELVEEITVEGEAKNVVHRNLTLVRASSSAVAYKHAEKLGRKGETSYKNSSGKRVRIKFRGISSLDVVHEPLSHGAELQFKENIGLSEEKIRKLIPPKNKLEAFMPIRKHKRRPDYASEEILKEAFRLVRAKQKR